MTHLSTHFDPDTVVTTVPPTASVVIGDVVILSPSVKEGDPEISPETLPSRFWRQLEIVAIPRGALFSFFGAETSSLGAKPKRPNDIVAPGFAC